MVRSRFVLACATVSLLALAPARASATSFTLSSYTVTAASVDPGLVLFINHVLGEPFSFNLNAVGDTETVPLFEVGTDETWVNFWDDWLKFPISVDFAFDAPPPPFGGTSTGITGGLQFLLVDFGYLVWDGPTLLDFGTTGQLRVTLTNALIPVPGARTVNATFELVRADVPEPATLVLLGSGLLGAAIRWRRRR